MLSRVPRYVEHATSPLHRAGRGRRPPPASAPPTDTAQVPSGSCSSSSHGAAGARCAGCCERRGCALVCSWSPGVPSLWMETAGSTFLLFFLRPVCSAASLHPSWESHNCFALSWRAVMLEFMCALPFAIEALINVRSPLPKMAAVLSHFERAVPVLWLRHGLPPSASV